MLVVKNQNWKKKKNLYVTNFDRQGCRGPWEIFSALLFPNQIINTIMETINIMNLQGLKNSLKIQSIC